MGFRKQNWSVISVENIYSLCSLLPAGVNSRAELVTLAPGLQLSGTIIMAGRKALVRGGQALGSFRKSVVNVLKSLVPILTSLLNISATVLSWAAKGIAWLASNLWPLALFGVLLLYRWLQSKRKL